MEIQLSQASKRYLNQKLFSDLDWQILPGERWGVLGGNGSGKSTLLKIVYGAESLSRGEIQHFSKQQKLAPQEAARRIALSGPYLELIEELPLREFLNFYEKFRPWPQGFSSGDLVARARLEPAIDRPIRYFSSGMKQRLRLSLALSGKEELILLDEPTANLDPQGVEWFQELLQAQLGQRSLIVASNFDEAELFYCRQQIDLKKFKG